MPNLLWFEWEVSKNGYSIIKDEPTRYHRRLHRRALKLLRQEDRDNDDEIEREVRWFEFSHLRIVPNSGEMKIYRPLDDNPTIFMTMANLKHSPEEYLIFANQYGLLNSHARYGMAEHGETIYTWYGHVEFTQYLIKRWNEASQSGSLDGFIEHFDHFPGLNIVLRKSFEEGQVALHISPTSLSTAITLQFLQAISSNFQLQRCAVCPTWFAFGTGTGRRKSALYCSNRCRKAAFLEREKSKK